MSGKNPIPNEQAYEGVRATNPPNVLITNHAPGSNQKRVQLGDIQIDNSTGIAYMLTDVTAGAQVWSVIGEGTTGDIITITGDSGGAQPGNAGNFNILGTANQVLVSGSASTETISLVGPYAPDTYTDHGVLVGAGTSSINALAVGATGEVLIGNTGNDPAFGALGVNSGLTAHGVLLGEANSAIVATTAGTDGQVLVGSTGLDPVFATIGTTTLTITPGAGTLSINVPTSLYAKKSVTLTATQIKGLNVTPVVIVPAQGAGTAIIPIQIQAKLVYGGTTAFTNPQDIALRYTASVGTADNPMAFVVGAGFIDQTESMYNLSGIDADVLMTAADVENLDVVLYNDNTAIAGNAANDSSVIVTLIYVVVTNNQ